MSACVEPGHLPPCGLLLKMPQQKNLNTCVALTRCTTPRKLLSPNCANFLGGVEFVPASAACTPNHK